MYPKLLNSVVYFKVVSNTPYKRTHSNKHLNGKPRIHKTVHFNQHLYVK